MKRQDSPHTSILCEELVGAFSHFKRPTLIDCTLGYGGHFDAMLVHNPTMMIGIDRDENALRYCDRRFTNRKNMIFSRRRFSEIASICQELDIRGRVDGIYADIGVSSPQFDLAIRGFSFMNDGPLDMRMDQTQKTKTAAVILNEEKPEVLAKIFREFGEEKRARYFAEKIVKRRTEKPFLMTKDFAEFIEIHTPYALKKAKHPATKIFQALRIYINDELLELETLLGGAFSCLKPGGRLAIITFHSLEDRIVKKFYQERSGKLRRSSLPRGLPMDEADVSRHISQEAKIIKPFPFTPTVSEVEDNPRSRSAKLRVLEKLH